MTRNVLFVCTANQCRSPVAEAICKTIARADGLDVRSLSAGTYALDGIAAQPTTIKAARAAGFDLTDHRSQPVSATLLKNADVILAMAAEHADWLRRFSPQSRGRIHLFKPYCEARHSGEGPLLDNDDIADPVGLPFEAHAAMVAEVEELLNKLVGRWKRGDAN